jgi:hypothetical protein
MKKKVVSIIGSGRTGSTLLMLILGSHPACFALGELSKLYRYYKTGKPLCGICQGSCEFWNQYFTESELDQLTSILGNTRLNPLIPLSLEKKVRKILNQEQVFNPYSAIFAKLNKQVLIDSSKEVDWVKERYQAPEFTSGKIENYLIHTVRDGRAVMSSKLRITPKLTATEFSHQWVKRIRETNEFFDQFPPERKMIVSYEKFITQNQETLQQLCQLLQIDFIPEMAQYWQHDHHLVAGNTGTRSLILKYRNEEATQVQTQVQKRQGNYYDNMGLQLKLDLRWKDELSLEQLEEFNRIAGDLNKPYEWNH